MGSINPAPRITMLHACLCRPLKSRFSMIWQLRPLTCSMASLDVSLHILLIYD